MATPSPAESPVVHNVATSRFEIRVGETMAVAEYVVTDGRIVFTHTFVPPELRGRGLAEKLVRAGLEWARAEGKKVVPECSYVATYIARHGEYQALLA